MLTKNFGQKVKSKISTEAQAKMKFSVICGERCEFVAVQILDIRYSITDVVCISVM